MLPISVQWFHSIRKPQSFHIFLENLPFYQPELSIEYGNVESHVQGSRCTTKQILFPGEGNMFF